MQITRNDYPLAPDKIEITEEMLHHSNILIADFNNIPIVNVKKLLPNFFDTKMCFITKTGNFI